MAGVECIVVQVLESFVGGWTGGDVGREDDAMSVRRTNYHVLGPVELLTPQHPVLNRLTQQTQARAHLALGRTGCGICEYGLSYGGCL